jgi:TctA family transporter
MSHGSPAFFVTRPIAAVITTVAVFFFLPPMITPWWRRLRGVGVAPVALGQ